MSNPCSETWLGREIDGDRKTGDLRNPSRRVQHRFTAEHGARIFEQQRRDPQRSVDLEENGSSLSGPYRCRRGRSTIRRSGRGGSWPAAGGHISLKLVLESDPARSG